LSISPNLKTTVIHDLIRDLSVICKDIFINARFKPLKRVISEDAFFNEKSVLLTILYEFKRSRHSGQKLLFLFIFFLFPCNSAFPQSPVKIGFLIRDKNDIAVQQAAELAIEEANNRRDYQGQKFELATKSCDGPWGIGSKQAVTLIYEDEVSIVVGALDGRNAHLAEQVTAKSHVVMLSTLSSDPTLSRAYVPWYFRLVPDDRQQAEVLVEQIYLMDKARKIAMISLDNYDGKMSADAFVDEVKEKGHLKPDVFIGLETKQLVEKLNKNSWDAVILAGTSEHIKEVITHIHSSKIFSFLNLFNFLPDDGFIDFSNIQFIKPERLDIASWSNFERTYQQVFGKRPPPSIAYVYDGILMACEAIYQFSNNPEGLRKGFKDLKYQGITGSIEFDKLGNREFQWKISEDQ